MIFSLNALASTPTTNTSVEYYDDGSYIVTTIEDISSSPGISFSSSTSTTKSKTVRYYNSEDTVMWYVKVTGTFTYGNGTSKCTSSSVTAKSYATTWKVTNKSASKSGNTAIATATAKQYFDGTVIKTINRTVKLTCSPTGVFS